MSLMRAQLAAQAQQITLLTRRVALLEKRILQMSQVDDDLKAAVTAMGKSVADAMTEMQALVAKILAAVNAPQVDAAAAESAAQEISKLASDLASATAAAQTAINPPAPTPAP